ncbi:MAG: type III-A CRISPR-associated RAMP protein Csm4 [Bryobacteraceae bacterium]
MPTERPALLVQLQPITPWRCGAGRPEEPASLVPSDSLFGALSDAMRLLGWLPEWLAEGARLTRMSSMFPAQNDVFYAPLPEAVRAYSGLRRVRLQSVRFAPLTAIQDLAAKKFDEHRWVVDLASGCLQSVDRAGAGAPYRPLERQRAAVDRFSGVAAATAATAGIEFSHNAGAWALFVFADMDAASVWSGRLKAAFRLLADDGIGGWRGAGWGRSRRPRYKEGELGRLLVNAGWKSNGFPAGGRWWTLGLFAPAESDSVAWDAGAYRTLMRGGWANGAGEKPGLRFVREGAILASAGEPAGRISESNVDGLLYGVLRYGAGLALPWREEG